MDETKIFNNKEYSKYSLFNDNEYTLSYKINPNLQETIKFENEEIIGHFLLLPPEIFVSSMEGIEIIYN